MSSRSKAMGLGAMLLFLIIAVVVLPIIVRYVDNMQPHFVAGFQDLSQQAVPTVAEQMNEAVSAVPAAAASAQLPSWRPDQNTDYLCRSPNNGGQPCPEGTFCDGATQSCVSNYIGGAVPDTGYFA